MVKRDVSDPQAYLADLGADERIGSVAPEAEEGLRYGMLDYPGLANLGAQKRYVALYVAPEVLAAHRDAFPGVDAGKSCLRFTKTEQADPSALAALLADVWAYRQAGGD